MEKLKLEKFFKLIYIVVKINKIKAKGKPPDADEASRFPLWKRQHFLLMNLKLHWLKAIRLILAKASKPNFGEEKCRSLSSALIHI